MKAGQSKIDLAWKRSELKDHLANPEFVRMSVADKAKVLEVSINTIYKYLKEISEEEWALIEEKARKQNAKDTVEINASLVEEAKKGSVEHQKLFLQWRLGWSPKQTNENINRNAELDGMTEGELEQKAADQMSLEVLEKALAKKKEMAALRVVDETGTEVSGA